MFGAARLSSRSPAGSPPPSTTRLRRSPGAECPDAVAALLAVALAAIGEDEGARAGRRDPDAESLHGIVEGGAVVALGRGQALDLDVGEAHGGGAVVTLW